MEHWMWQQLYSKTNIWMQLPHCICKTLSFKHKFKCIHFLCGDCVLVWHSVCNMCCAEMCSCIVLPNTKATWSAQHGHIGRLVVGWKCWSRFIPEVVLAGAVWHRDQSPPPAVILKTQSIDLPGHGNRKCMDQLHPSLAEPGDQPHGPSLRLS